jgi:uncharacterized protein (TIGR02217 family)
MAAFHEVRFPLRLALGTSGGPVRRNQRWRNSRRAYDAGSGVRSVSDLYAVLEFFEARGGQLYGFRFRDPVDFRSCPPLTVPTAMDQRIGTGDGVTARFQLSKTYADAAGGWTRTIAKPVAGSVLVSVNGVAVTGFTTDHETGIVTFAGPQVPAAGAAIRAGFEFDVPVRFDIDRIDVSLSAFEAGRIPSIPLVEILP